MCPPPDRAMWPLRTWRCPSPRRSGGSSARLRDPCTMTSCWRTCPWLPPWVRTASAHTIHAAGPFLCMAHSSLPSLGHGHCLLPWLPGIWALCPHPCVSSPVSQALKPFTEVFGLGGLLHVCPLPLPLCSATTWCIDCSALWKICVTGSNTFLCNTCLSDYRHLCGQHLWSTLGYFFKTLLKVLLIINIFPEVCRCLGHCGLVSLTAQFALKPLLW